MESVETNRLKIDNKIIGKGYPAFIIAEAGVNHNNNLKNALKMVDIAKKSGADAIKFQTFLTDSIQLPNSIKPNYQKKIKGKSYYEVIKSLEPSLDDQTKVFKYCKKKNIIFLSTPYDKKSVDFLDSLGVPAFKIASTDLTNHILIKHIAKKGKPILISSGLSESKHVDQAIDLLNRYKLKNKSILLQTTSDYPVKNKDVNLRVILEYIKKYKILVGFSDHTRDYVASLGAVALGACVLEKHFTLDRTLPGPDQSSSLEPSELKIWIEKIRMLEESLGTFNKKITLSEQKNLSMRKILTIKPMKKDTIITKDDLLALRGNEKGILPLEQNIKKILGKKLRKNILIPSQFSWDMINNK